MILKNRVIADQMNSSVFSSPKNPWIVSLLIPIFTFACGYFTVLIIIFTSLIFSAFLFLKPSKQNVQVIQPEKQSSDQIDSNQDANVENKGCINMGSPDSSSESEILDLFTCTTEEDSEFDGWEYSGEVCRRSGCSDGSISDEESLIEIELFGGNYDGYKGFKDEEEPKLYRRQKSPDSFLWWPEMNEEENMIEIDLSVGSIKCSRIEIKA